MGYKQAEIMQVEPSQNLSLVCYIARQC